MGGSLKKLSSTGGLSLFRKNSRIVMLGLDAAGKTTILYKLKLDETVSTIPTIGFNVETVKHSKSVSFTVWDIGGQQKLRPLWKHYLKGTDGLIFVVDCWDFSRVDEVVMIRKEKEALSASALQMNHVILNYCRTALSAISGSVAGVLGLYGIHGFVFYIFSSLLMSVLLIGKANFTWQKYFLSSWDIWTTGVLGGTLTFILFWTFLYGLVNVY
ncbi:hypothetical protein ACHWQZ_G019210 [Mnemiopsis leidyi]